MIGELWIIGAAVCLGLYMAWNIGANDVANSMADAVGSGSISIRNAVILAAICEFAGAVLVGASVTETVRSGIVPPNATLMENPELMILGMASALLAAAVWLNISTYFGMPVSTTHSIVGAVAGFGIVACGWAAVDWGVMGKIVASWFISPIAGAVLAFIFFHIIRKLILSKEKPSAAAIKWSPAIVFLTVGMVVIATIYKGLNHVLKDKLPFLGGSTAWILAAAIGALAAWFAYWLLKRRLGKLADAPLREQIMGIERVYAPLVVITSCSVAFAHGANDVANSVGPLAAIVEIARSGHVVQKVGVPFWILALGGGGIVLGLATYGWQVMKTVGTKITQMTPTRGVAADLAATATVLVCSRLGLPVSTTHTLVGAIIGVGMARGIGAVDMRVTRNIFGAWFITVPAAGIMAMIIFVIGRAILL